MARTWKYKVLLSNHAKPEDLESKIEEASKDGWDPVFYQVTSIGATQAIVHYLILRSPASGSED